MELEAAAAALRAQKRGRRGVKRRGRSAAERRAAGADATAAGPEMDADALDDLRAPRSACGSAPAPSSARDRAVRPRHFEGRARTPDAGFGSSARRRRANAAAAARDDARGARRARGDARGHDRRAGEARRRGGTRRGAEARSRAPPTRRAVRPRSSRSSRRRFDFAAASACSTGCGGARARRRSRASATGCASANLRRRGAAPRAPRAHTRCGFGLTRSRQRALPLRPRQLARADARRCARPTATARWPDRRVRVDLRRNAVGERARERAPTTAARASSYRARGRARGRAPRCVRRGRARAPPRAPALPGAVRPARAPRSRSPAARTRTLLARVRRGRECAGALPCREALAARRDGARTRRTCERRASRRARARHVRRARARCRPRARAPRRRRASAAARRHARRRRRRRAWTTSATAHHQPCSTRSARRVEGPKGDAGAEPLRHVFEDPAAARPAAAREGLHARRSEVGDGARARRARAARPRARAGAAAALRRGRCSGAIDFGEFAHAPAQPGIKPSRAPRPSGRALCRFARHARCRGARRSPPPRARRPTRRALSGDFQKARRPRAQLRVRYGATTRPRAAGLLVHVDDDARARSAARARRAHGVTGDAPRDGGGGGGSGRRI